MLVLTDHITRYVQAYPTRNMTAKTTAEVLFNNFFVHCGFSLRLHSDQGTNFVGKVIQELCRTTGIREYRTAPYHPMGNGLCERFNRTLMNMLGTLEPRENIDWKSHVGPLVHTYIYTRHESTGHTPFSLRFGRHQRLPADLVFGIYRSHEQKETSYSRYVESLRERLKSSYQCTAEASRRSKARQKQIMIRGLDVLPLKKVTAC